MGFPWEFKGTVPENRALLRDHDGSESYSLGVGGIGGVPLNFMMVGLGFNFKMQKNTIC